MTYTPEQRAALIADYANAYRALHSQAPVIRALPNGRFQIISKTGEFDGYSAKDVANLTRGLRVLARRAA
jgi:hypothetical protein